MPEKGLYSQLSIPTQVPQGPAVLEGVAALLIGGGVFLLHIDLGRRLLLLLLHVHDGLLIFTSSSTRPARPVTYSRVFSLFSSLCFVTCQ